MSAFNSWLTSLSTCNVEKGEVSSTGMSVNVSAVSNVSLNSGSW